jgi:hypothetical protein
LQHPAGAHSRRRFFAQQPLVVLTVRHRGGVPFMKFLDHLEEWLITFLMGVATLIIFVAVVHRYLASASIPGLQDWLLTST